MGGQFVVIIFRCCCLFVYLVFCGYKFRRVHAQACVHACAFLSHLCQGAMTACRCLFSFKKQILGIWHYIWNLICAIDKFYKTHFFLSRSPYFLMYWSDNCRKDSTLSPADVRRTIQNYWVCVYYVMPSGRKEVLKSSGLINCFVDSVNTGSHIYT